MTGRNFLSFILYGCCGGSGSDEGDPRGSEGPGDGRASGGIAWGAVMSDGGDSEGMADGGTDSWANDGGGGGSNNNVNGGRQCNLNCDCSIQNDINYKSFESYC